MLSFQGSKVTTEGPFFTKDVTKTIIGNAMDALEDLALLGERYVQQNLRIGIENPTGFTEGAVEGFTYKRQRIGSGMTVQSIYGKVRMKPGLSRHPGSSRYPASRRPYIINSVLEGGGYGGSRSRPSITISRKGKLRKRSSAWVSGTRQQRHAVHQWRDAYKALNREARIISKDLTAGLEAGPSIGITRMRQ